MYDTFVSLKGIWAGTTTLVIIQALALPKRLVVPIHAALNFGRDKCS